MRLFPTILVSPTRYESGHMVELTQEADNKYAVDTGRFVGVLTEESLSMPLDVSARFGLRSEFTRCGLVAFGGIQVDPGFKGRLAISLFNAGPEPRDARREEDVHPSFNVWTARHGAVRRRLSIWKGSPKRNETLS